MYNARYLQPQVNTEGLLAHWKMWDGKVSANSIFDYALNANLGADSGTVNTAYPGFFFNEGSGGQINFGSDTTIDNIWDSGGSLSIWIKPASLGEGDTGRIFDKSTNTTIGWLLYCNSATTLRFYLVTAGTNGQWTFPVDVTGDVWQHIVVTYDSGTSAAGGGPTVYVDGEAVAVTEAVAPNNTRTTDAAGTLYMSARSAGSRNWDGKMDDAMLFNGILTAQEAKSIFSVTRQRYGV